MTRLRPCRGAFLGLLLGVAIGGTACRKGKPATGGNPDRTPDSGTPGDGKGPPSDMPSRPQLPAGWKDFKHPEGAYRVFVPAQPTRPKQSGTSLRLKQPLQPLEARESTHEVHPDAKQPVFVSLQVTVFHPDARSAFAMLEPDYKVRKMPAGWTITSDRVVTWGGLRATELVVEVSSPKRAYSVSRWAVTADRLYQFVMRREDRMPSDAERSAFFDSFTPGN